MIAEYSSSHGKDKKLLMEAQLMSADSKAKIEYLRMRLLKLKQSKDQQSSQGDKGSGESGSSNKITDNSLEARIEELRHHLRIESACLDGAKNALKLLQSAKDKDKKALQEVIQYIIDVSSPISLLTTICLSVCLSVCLSPSSNFGSFWNFEIIGAVRFLVFRGIKNGRLVNVKIAEGLCITVFKNFQAQQSMSESSQKLDLIRQALDIHRQQLPAESSIAHDLKAEIEATQAMSPGSMTFTNLGDPFSTSSHQGGMMSRNSGSQKSSTSFSRTSSVTGKLEVITTDCVLLFVIFFAFVNLNDICNVFRFSRYVWFFQLFGFTHQISLSCL